MKLDRISVRAATRVAMHVAIFAAILVTAGAACALAGPPAIASPVRLTGPPPAGLLLTWSDCLGGLTSTPDMPFACDNNNTQFDLVCAVVMPQALNNVIAAELVLDMQHSASVLPDWWRQDGSGTTFGCRANFLEPLTDFTTNPSCTDAWTGMGIGANQGFSIGLPDHPLQSQVRFKEVAVMTPGSTATLNTGVDYGLIKLVFHTFNSAAPGTVCDGCTGSACIVFESVWLLVSPGTGTDQYLSSASSPGSNWATWQGATTSCAAVPVRRSTWGQVKSLYH